MKKSKIIYRNKTKRYTNTIGKATVVGVGGSHGNVYIALAKEFPDVYFVVQDLPQVLADAKAKSPLGLSHRVTFQALDFFPGAAC